MLGGGAGMGAKPGGGSTLRGGAEGAASMGRTIAVAGSTLRAGAQGGCSSMGRTVLSVGSTLRDGAALGGAAMWLSKVVRSWSALTSLSVRGANGELADGCVKAWMISWIPARTRSVEEARGIVTLEGNQESVSVMRVRRVSQIQTVKQR